ncbi:MAG: hypothetical protein IT159_05035 [Bryobacterales bacterium]|nr:hypothetical protein [Bryobacterales bacterium]
MASGLITGLRRFVLWDYHRGSWQYDAMVILILAFVFLTPREWFRDRPGPASVVMIEGHQGSDVWLAPELLVGLPEGQRLLRANSLVQGKFGKRYRVVKVQPILDPESEVMGYMAQVQP